MKCEFKHQDMQIIIWFQVKHVCVIVTHLKLRVAVMTLNYDNEKELKAWLISNVRLDYLLM